MSVRQCLLLRKVLVAKIVYLIYVLIGPHTCSSTCDEHYETIFSVCLDFAFNLEPNAHTIRE